jgi:glycosyltransferase involved in cell wall biosynthesis
MTSIAIAITTYGEDTWRDLAWARAYPSAAEQGAEEIIVRHHPDLTIGPARNKTISEASADYIVCCDADDELAPGYITTMREAIAQADDPLMSLFYPTVRYIYNGEARPDLLRPIGDLRHDNFLVVGTMVARRLFQSVGGFSDYDHGFEDWAVWAKCWRAGAKIIPIPDAIYIAYINRFSKHRTFWRSRREQAAEHQRIQAELFPEGV